MGQSAVSTVLPAKVDAWDKVQVYDRTENTLEACLPPGLAIHHKYFWSRTTLQVAWKEISFLPGSAHYLDQTNTESGDKRRGMRLCIVTAPYWISRVGH